MTTGFFAGLGLAGMGGISNVLRPMPDVAGLNQMNDIVNVDNVDNLLGNMDNFQLQPTPQLTPDQLNLMNPVLNRDAMIQPLYNRQNIGIQAQPPQGLMDMGICLILTRQNAHAQLIVATTNHDEQAHPRLHQHHPSYYH